MPNSLAVIGTPTVSFVTEDANLLTLTAQGSISITDTNAGQAFFKTSVIASSGDLGSLSIAANGSYVYSVADSKVQYLGAGETKVDTFTVTSLDGTTKQVAFTIVGVNDTAMIGTPTVVDVTEDATSPILKATGSISITDADQNQAAFKTTVASAAGNLGTLVLQSNGSYTYSVADSAVQYLGAGQVKTDTFTVTSLDGTLKLISFNVHGTNDAAVIGTPDHHDVTEDASNPNLSVTGSISITDADQGQSAFKTIVNSASGNLGSLVLAANGTYTYSVANAATQYLGAGDTKVDTFTVTSLDGTQKQISFTIHGINDAAVIGVPTVHDVTEDATNPVIYATGTVSITDADQGESAFQPTLQAGNGNLGALVMGSNGAYIYAVLDSAVQYLGAGETKVDSFTLTALDGTSKVVTFTIHGTNDVAVIGAPAVHDVTEDVGVSTAGNLTAAGTLSISDADQNQASFQTTVTAATGTLGHLSIAANGAYSYTVADSAVQYLGASDSKVEIFTVTAFDGTQKQVSFTIHGANDAAAIGTPTVHDVTKNASPTTLTATGVISITDADQNQASFQTTVGSAAGNLGHLVIAANGAYTYSVANSATQYLGAADVKVDTFTVTSLDGTPKQVSFTIHGGSGAGTPATIGNPSNATVTEDVGGATLTATGTILVTDPDAGQTAFQTTVTPGSGNLGGLVLQSNGSYTYSVADSAVQYLGAGEAKVDTFTIKSIDGTSKVVSFTIQGANDAATISDPVVHSVTEDVNVSGAGNLTATGQLTAVDADQNQSSFQAGSAAGAGNLGALAFAANGTYTYSVANSAVQSLGGNDSHIDTFTVHSLDGTVKVISFTVQGANDAATISDPVVHSVTEDLNPVNGNLTATGQLTASDVDNGQSSFQPGATGIAGNLGTLTLAANGTYTYSVANSATQSLGAGQTHTDSFTIHSLDGTPKTVTFDVIGANDAAVISDPVQHDVTEDTGTTLSVSGQITVTDADQGQSQFSTTVPASGNLGHLTITSDGHYTYSVDNALVQGLAAGEVRIETFTVSSVDGTQKPVSFTIHGTQDAPILTADNVSGADDGLIHLSIKTHLVDDSGTLGTVSIKGIPDTYTLNHGTPFEDGHWEVSASDLGMLALVPGAQAHADTLVLQVSVASIEGGHPSVATTSMTVDVTAGLHDTSNRAVDGYIAGAFVFADKNGNGVFDDGEASAITNADGSFTLHNPVGTLIMTGGTDVSTGLAFTGTLKAPEGSTVVTPLTTLITSLAVGSVSAADATARVAAAFHLDGVDLTTFDPVPLAIGGDPAATAVLSAGVQVQSTVAQISAVGGSQDAVFGAIADAISAAGSNPVDLSDTATGGLLETIATASGVSTEALQTVVSVVSASNTVIQNADNVTAIAQAGQVAQGDAATSLGGITNFGDHAQTDAVTLAYVDNLQTHVDAAQVATGIAVLGTSGNDVLTGTAAIDTIDGLEGNDRISGGDSADQLFGGAGNDQITGNAGNDKIDGGTGFDRAVYIDATGGVIVDMAAGTVSGAGVGSDTLVNVEGVVGSDFADTYDATGFAGVTGLAGAVVGYNEFEGGKGDDQITGLLNGPGQALTRLSYLHATDGVTVDFQAHTAHATNGTLAQDLASIGQDSFTNVSGVIGSAFNDTLRGTNNGPGTYESYEGRAGNDLIDGRGGYDIAVYSNDAATMAGITVHLAAGTVVGDATIGTDTLVAVEAVRGTNFADVFDATGFGAGGANIGSLGTFNDFQGAGGDDTIIGNGATRLNYTNAAGAVTADLQGTTVSTNPLLVAGTATALGEGIDSFTGVNAVQGSAFGDTLLGSNLNNTFTGLGGDDYIDGRGGFDVASYNSLTTATTGVSVNLAAGTATGINDGSIGHDTLRSIEGVQGTFFADTFDATGYGLAGAANVSNSNGSFNQFEGLAGDDVITGNGNTRVIYGNALAAVTVDLSLGTAHGTIAGDAAGVGTDLFTGGVFSVTGSAFGDTLIGNANSNMFVGGGGNDAIDGGAGGDVAIFSGIKTQYNISINGAGVVTVADTVGGRDGTDTLTNVEVLQFTNANVLMASGTQAAPVDLSDTGLFFNAQANALTTLTGSADDYVKINQGLSGHTIDLGGGANDTVILGITGGYNLTLANVEHVVGTTGDDFIGFNTGINGLTVDMGDGFDTINLANGLNSVSVINTENLNGSDFNGAASNDTLTLLNDVTGLSVNLAQGTNTLNLAAGTNSLAFVGNINTVNGTGAADVLTLANGIYNATIDLGGGTDTLTVGVQYDNLTLLNVEHLVVTSNDAFYTLNNNQNGLSVDLGTGTTGLQVASGANALALTNVSTVSTADYSGAPSDDTLTLTNDVSGLTVNLQQGSNTLNLAAGANDLVNVFNVDRINGSATDDVLTIEQSIFTPGHNSVIDLGGGNDTLNLNSQYNGVTTLNVEHVNGSTGSDTITIANTTGTTTVTGGGGFDTVTASAATDIIRYTDASESTAATGLDTVNNFDATQDKFLLDGVAGLAGSVHFMASGVLDGSPIAPQAEAILVDVGGQQQLQIDVNGDGVIGAGDISVIMNGLNGNLSDANFSVVTPNHAPTDILLSGAAIVPENSAPGSVVGLLSDMDPDAGDGATYALTSNPGGLFAIVNGNQIVTTVPLDFEQAASHQVTVQVTDTAGATFSKNFQIGVTNVNEAPTDVTLSNNTVAENSAANAVVGFLTAVDPDAGSTATYEMIDDAGGLFSLVGNQVVTTGPLDFEQAASHQITVRATDAGGLSVDRTFAISTTNVNEAPTAVVLSNSSVAENSAANTVVGALSALDPDASDSATFTLTSNPGGLFAILNGNLVTTAPLDFEQATSHSVTVRATDAGGLTHDTTFAIATTNINEAPTDISLSNTVIPQGTANGNVVGTLSALDPDAGDTFSYTLTDNAAGQFGISGGNIVVAGPLTTGTEQITVVATDAGGLSFQKTIGITVNGGSLVVGTSGPDTLTGTAGDDTIQGLGANDRLQGLAGNDILDGGQGFDRAVYTEAASGITVNLAAGTVTGGAGSDTLINIEGIVGSENVDTFDATGFTGDAGILGTQIGFNEFEGRGGNDTITGAVNSQGALLTRISYASASGSVTVDLQAHSATGDSSVGTDLLVGSGFGGVIGSAGADTLLGNNNANGTVEIFDGRAGNDLINGRGGFDRADYSSDPATAVGITVNMASGIVTGDGTVGTDTLRSVESVRGTNLADSYDATGFAGNSTNAGSSGTFNEFVGMGGDDNIIGNNNTRISYINATGGVVVDMQTGATPETGTADGDASTGHDTFSGVNNVQGSMYDDILRGSNSAATETFYGGAGNDQIDGRGGFDLATYNNIYFSTGAITVNMGAGTVTGDASVGTDTLRSIEAVQGTNFNDVFNASTFGTGTALNIGNNGTFSQFEGLGGNDTITGNGNTRVIYSSASDAVSINMAAGTASGGASVGNDTFTGVNSATGSNLADTYVATGFVDTGAFSSGTFNLFEGLGGADTITGNGSTRIAYTQAASGVSVDLSTGNAHSIAASDGAGIGVDNILGGVNSVQGSNFNDIITGGTGNEFLFGGTGVDTLNGGGGNDTLTGQGGNDALDGGTGTDMASFTGARIGYTVNFNTPGAGQIQVIDSQGAARDGTDILTNVEVLQFSDATVLLTTGTALNPVDISAFNLGAGQIVGTGADDFLAVGGNLFGHQIDLGVGTNDTVILASPNFYQLNLANVEHVTGSTGNENVNLVNNAAGLVVDLGDGTDNMTLAGGLNSLSVTNVEILTTTDFTGTAVNDTLTLQNNISGGMNVNLGLGDNTLNLAAGSNSFNELFGIQHVNGTASNDVLTLANSYFTFDNNGIIDLAGGNNTLNFGGGGFSMTALNIQHIVGNSLDNIVTFNNDLGGVSIDLGTGTDHVNLAGGLNSVSLTGVDSVSGSDFSGPASDDTLVLLTDVTGLTIDLGPGTNTVTLAAGTNSLDGLYNINQINGSSTDDVLTLTQQSFGTIDMGGGNDTVTFAGANAGTVTVVNAETVNGSSGVDYITIGNTSGSTTITGGQGADTIVASAGSDNFHFASASESQTGNGDTIVNFDAASDTFNFSGMAAQFTGSIHFVDTAAFDGSAGSPHSEARVDQSGRNATLQIDVNGNGVMDGNDIEIHLANYTGTLHDQNFLLS